MLTVCVADIDIPGCHLDYASVTEALATSPVVICDWHVCAWVIKEGSRSVFEDRGFGGV